MNGTDIAKCLGEISDEIIAQGLTPPVRPKRKRYLRYFSVAAVLVLGICLGAFAAPRIINLFATNNQGSNPFFAEEAVYDIVLTEKTCASSLYAYTDEPGDDVFAAVKKKFGSGYDTAIRVFRIDGADDEKRDYYWFPKVINGEIREVVYAAVTKKGIHMGYARNSIDFLNGVSGLTSADSPGYMVSCADALFCVVGDTAYCTEIIWDEMDYLGEIVLPKGDISVVQVN